MDAFVFKRGNKTKFVSRIDNYYFWDINSNERERMKMSIEVNFFSKSKWISDKVMTGMRPEENIRSVILRKCFDCVVPIKKATLYCCGLGQAVYHINGENITDEVFVTHFTKYDSRVLYNIFDVTTFINTGKNAIGVHLGNWFYNDCNTHWN